MKVKKANTGAKVVFMDDAMAVFDAQMKRFSPPNYIVRKAQIIKQENLNRFSANRVYNEYRVNTEVIYSVLEKVDKNIPKLLDQMVDIAVNDDVTYTEFLHGRITSPYFMKGKNRKFISIFWELYDIFEKHEDVLPFLYGTDALNTLHCIITVVRDTVMFRKWEQFCKAYTFSKELEESFLDSYSTIDFPVDMIEKLPFRTLYIKFPENSVFATDYEGVFVYTYKGSGYVELQKESTNALEKLMNDKPMMKRLSMENDDFLAGILAKEKARFKDEDDFMSLNMVFVNKTPDEETYQSYSYYSATLAYTFGDDKICHFDESEVKAYIRECNDFAKPSMVCKMIKYVFYAIMYLGSKNADIRLAEPPKKTKKNSTRISKDLPIDYSECGFVYGEKVREIKKFNKEHADEDFIAGIDDNGNVIKVRRPTRPHPVRAHCQRYHVGKGRKETIYIFKDAFYVGANNDKITNVSKVE